MFSLNQSVKLADFELGNRWYTTNTTSFTFPDTLGALFFGLSLAVYYTTIKRIARSRIRGQNKCLSFLALQLLVVFGIIAHAFDVQNVQMNISSWTMWNDGTRFVSAWAYGEHGHFVEKLHGFIVIFTGWVAGYILAARAYFLAGRIRWLGLLFSFLLFSMFLVQLILYCIGFDSAVPSYPIINLVLQIPVTLAVLYNTYKQYQESKTGEFNIVEDVLVDSGALLTVGLILQTIFPFVGIGIEPMNSLLPHLQNITICTVFVRMIDGEGVGGVIRLADEESPNIVSAPLPPA